MSLAVDYFIVGNKLTDLNSGRTHIIHIDHGYITIGAETHTFILETTGVTINNMFKSFSSYVFSIQNGLFQFSGMCYHISGIKINSTHVRVEGMGNMSIIENMLQPLDTRIVPPELVVTRPDGRNIIMPPTKEKTLSEISRSSQNVHDTFVLNKFVRVYNKMQNILGWSDVCKKILGEHNIPMFSRLVNGEFGMLSKLITSRTNVSDYLIIVLAYIQNQNGYVFRFDATETEILSKIMYEIKDKPDAINILIDSLKDCVENHHIVCLTGRVARMLNSIEYLYTGDKIKASECRQLLLSQASKIKYNSVDELIETLQKDNPNVDNLREEVISWELPDQSE